ncbi:hypothetical protein B0A54_02739 [Friedmanniomyces endolithicus]|uniref:Tyrosine specific protein phosphatases domain-containing protein n=1 Tax=Friedmanniomyces endolithicus TaxID=329885 RepID=A0A4U0VDX6_9PEZI|nr:hypothetical protein B0A54_02739 [Friedmanniomyces endolithicus]
MTSLPSPPFIDVPGIANFRGVGQGYVGPGLLYRSADPTRATKAGLEKMSKDLGKRLGKEWEGEAVDDPNVFQKYGITRQWIPVFAEQDYGPEQVGLRYKEYTRSGSEGFVKAYSDILVSGKDAYGTVFRHLAQEKPTPCLIHCTAGKDRTGVLVALLFLHAGAPADVIANEYALTDLGLAEKKPEFIERLLLNPALGGNREGVENMVSSKRENMLATLEMIRKEYGSAGEYMKKQCGLSDAEVQRVRKNIMDGALEKM